MKLESQTRFALLGLLHQGPRSGYDLKQEVDDSIRHFWREGWGSIYPALRSLEAEGMIAKRIERQQGRPDRNVYTLREAGKQALKEWLGRDVTPQAYRNELLLKLFFGRNAEPTVNRVHVERFQQQCATEIATYEAVLRDIDARHSRHPDAPFWKITLSYGLHHSRGLKKWAEETLKVLKDVQEVRRV